MVKTKPIVLYNGERTCIRFSRGPILQSSLLNFHVSFSILLLLPPKGKSRSYTNEFTFNNNRKRNNWTIYVFKVFRPRSSTHIRRYDICRSLPLKGGSSRAVLPQDNRHGINNQNFSLARKCIHFSLPMTSLCRSNNNNQTLAFTSYTSRQSAWFVKFIDSYAIASICIFGIDHLNLASESDV